MNLWDSVHRGLEKASQEAARIAKTQRLRSTIDNLSRQVYTQHDAIVGRTMDLFTSGQLTQSELIPLCQELINIHNQLNQAQNELQLVQAPPPQPAQLAPGATPISQTPSGTSYSPPIQDAETIYAPPPPPGYQPYADSTVVAPAPPPPPGMEPRTVSSMETMAMNEPRFCFLCRTEIVPGNAFCHNCGTPVTDLSASYLPTTRGSVEEAENMETVRASGTPDQNATVRADDPSLRVPDPGDDQATVRADSPSVQRPATSDGGQ